MYKITLFDEVSCSFVSGTVSFFVDEIEEFEEGWLKNPLVSNDQKSRYRMSKEGYLVSDYYVTTEDNNIFQQDSAANVLEEADYLLQDRKFRLHNLYECESIMYAKEAWIKFRKIRFKDKYYWVGKYKLSGACIAEELDGKYWTNCHNWGNKILNIVNHSDILRKDFAGKRRTDCSKSIFEKDTVETYCWVPIAISEGGEYDFPFNEEYLLSDEILDRLMRDILGEAG